MSKDLKKALEEIEYFLLDMDGTVFVDDFPIGDMANTLKFLREKGKKIVYLSNNTSKSADTYIEKLKRLDFYDEKDEIYSAGVATCEYLNTYYKGKSVYALATKSYKAEIVKHGINLIDTPTADIALMTYDTELTYADLCTFVKTLENGAIYISTHPDNRCNTIDGFIPDAGSFVKMIEASNGFTPSVIVGKPNTIMGDTLKARFNKKGNNFIMVGDRLDTDLMFGINNGFYSLTVLSGESTIVDVENNNVKPDFVLNSLNDIKNYF
jgi:HAD superfamily hydrolase (TIGR01450 family)